MNHRLIRRLAAALATLLSLGGCSREPGQRATARGASTVTERAQRHPGTEAPRPTPRGDAGADASDARTASNSPCPPDMVLVQGKLCTAAKEVCMKEDPEWVKDHSKSERCLEFKKPSVCVSHVRIPMRFCIDRYEWPDKKGALPRTLTPWYEARKLCASVGKRLCDEAEWLLACEGDQMLPYTYGYKRDATKCSIDRPYIRRRKLILRWNACMKSPTCKKEFARLDQRVPSGSMPGCVSPFGVYDMNGNVNEWVNIPGEKYPHRAGLKGGWWGPVRDRCRPTVIFHKEEDWGYEVGFRCCKYPSDEPDAGRSPMFDRYPLGGRGVLPPPHPAEGDAGVAPHDAGAAGSND